MRTRLPRCRRFTTLVASFVALAYAAPKATASDIEISIEVAAGGQHVRTTQTEIEPSHKKPHPRRTCHVKAREPFVVSWKATNVGKSETLKDVTIHCVVAAEKEPGQLTVPSLRDPIEESALWMDFKPGRSTTGKFSLAIDEPGVYLLRVETREMLQTHGHEHYAALDLICGLP